MKELTYTRCGDYDIPDLELSYREDRHIGKYGRMRKRYLQEHRPVLFNCLLLSERLYPHLLVIDEAAHQRLDTLMPQLMKAAGVTEQLKAADPMAWIRKMNNIRNRAAEVVSSEIVYA